MDQVEQKLYEFYIQRLNEGFPVDPTVKLKIPI